MFLCCERKPKMYKELSQTDSLLKNKRNGFGFENPISNGNGMYYTNGNVATSEPGFCKSFTRTINRDWRK